MFIGVIIIVVIFAVLVYALAGAQRAELDEFLDGVDAELDQVRRSRRIYGDPGDFPAGNGGAGRDE